MAAKTIRQTVTSSHTSFCCCCSGWTAFQIGPFFSGCDFWIISNLILICSVQWNIWYLIIGVVRVHSWSYEHVKSPVSLYIFFLHLKKLHLYEWMISNVELVSCMVKPNIADHSFIKLKDHSATLCIHQLGSVCVKNNCCERCSTTGCVIFFLRRAALVSRVVSASRDQSCQSHICLFSSLSDYTAHKLRERFERDQCYMQLLPFRVK